MLDFLEILNRRGYLKANVILGEICTVSALNIQQLLDKDCSFHLKAESLLTQTGKPRGAGFAALHHRETILGCVGR